MNKNVETKKDYVQNFSTRIPWKDNDYKGRIDDNPKHNNAAQVIPNIASSRDLELEEKNKGKLYKDIGSEKFKNWITENSAFMSETELEVRMNHPYKKGKNEKFVHYQETSFKLKPYSFLLRPFSWTLKENAKVLASYYNFSFDYEANERMLSWDSSWVSHGESQKAIFEYFFSGVVPNKSLIFPYYKQVPFIEDNRRVVAGIGSIVNSVELKEYSSDGSRDEKNFIWENNVLHSIRSNGDNGFLMPYLEISEYLKNNPDFDVASVIIFEPEGFRDEFSYTAEWVSYDAAIDVLNQAKKALISIAKINLKVANQDWINLQLEYVDKQLKTVWNQRGIFPGLSSALYAFGIRYSFDIARIIDTSENDLISELKLYFSGEKEIGDFELDESLAEKEDEFNGLIKNENKLKYFELLSRLNLSINQARNIWERFKDNSSKIINNPYLLYELTRKEKPKFQIAISQIDNSMFINDLVKNKYPLTKPTKMRTEADKRRFRAMAMFVLERATNYGHTLLSYEQIVIEISNLPLDRKTDFQTEKIEGISEFLEEGGLRLDNENKYIKLKEYQEYKNVIFNTVSNRLDDNLGNNQNWSKIINNKFKDLKKGNEEKDKLAREEKAKALETLESSTISVFLGRAGTGKTSALGIFASIKEIKDGGLLALTPTGKARIQLENSFKENQVEAECMTIAQFLVRSGGFSWSTLSYKLPNKSSTSIAETVIIDESSMLTENMFAGVLKLVSPHAKRIIFTGDKNQLPPIGAGRPFTDLIRYLESNAPERIALLTTEMRQGDTGDDLAFAQLFSDSETVDKIVIQRIKNSKTDERLEYVEYVDIEDMENLFYNKVLLDIANMESKNDLDGFNKSLGGIKNGDYINYNTSKCIENWQILTPTRWLGIGTYYLNEQIHQQYRQDIVDDWNDKWYKKSKPQSVQNIVFGDKVISNVNENKECWNREESKKDRNYIANGEIGIMINYPKQFGKNDKNTKYYKFMFNSYDGSIFSYNKSEFGGEEGDSKLELAYALTVHKSQGSGFNKTLVVINGKSAFLSKELLYTAFSRQKDKLKVLSDIPITELLKYTNDWYSDTKQRYTDLFEKPKIIEIELDKQKRYFEENLIHKTVRGEMVRSKSEVIVANILNDLEIDYTYEELLSIKGEKYLPDFTIRYQGRTAYLEHLGMLGNNSYKDHWKKKKSNYKKSGITEQDGNLIITQDGLNGSLDSKKVEESINNWKNNR